MRAFVPATWCHGWVYCQITVIFDQVHVRLLCICSLMVSSPLYTLVTCIRYTHLTVGSRWLTDLPTLPPSPLDWGSTTYLPAFYINIASNRPCNVTILAVCLNPSLSAQLDSFVCGIQVGDSAVHVLSHSLEWWSVGNPFCFCTELHWERERERERERKRESSTQFHIWASPHRRLLDYRKLIYHAWWL